MCPNRLQLNSAKTKILWSASSHRFHQLPQTTLCVDTSSVVIRDLGIFLDSDVSTKSHVMQTVSTSFDQSVVLCRGLFSSHWWCYSSSVVLTTATPRSSAYLNISFNGHITPLLRQLHWLEVKQRIEFKVVVLVYKCLQGSAPHYPADELCRTADIQSRSCLRSASSSQLIVRQTRRITLSDRSFLVAGPRLWNTLLQHVTSASSLQIVKSRLKTHLFSSFP